MEIKYDSEGAFDPVATWGGLSDADLLARMMLSEQSNKILDPVKYTDAIGTGSTALNRLETNQTNPDKFFIPSNDPNLFNVLVTQGDYDGLDGDTSTNYKFAADPGSYPEQFDQADRLAGHKAYNQALEYANGILDESISDPTNGRLFYADAVINSDGTLGFLPRTEFSFVNSGLRRDYQSINAIQQEQQVGPR